MTTERAEPLTAGGKQLARHLRSLNLPDDPESNWPEQAIAEVELGAWRDLLDEVETLCEDNGQNAIRVDDLAALVRDRAVSLATLDAERAARAPEGGRLQEALRAYQRAVISIPGIEDGAAHEPWQERLRNVISRYGGVR